MNLHDGAFSLCRIMQGVLKATFSSRIFCFKTALKKQSKAKKKDQLLDFFFSLSNVPHIAVIEQRKPDLELLDCRLENGKDSKQGITHLSKKKKTPWAVEKDTSKLLLLTCESVTEQEKCFTRLSYGKMGLSLDEVIYRPQQ